MRCCRTVQSISASTAAVFREVVQLETDRAGVMLPPRIARDDVDRNGRSKIDDQDIAVRVDRIGLTAAASRLGAQRAGRRSG